MKNSKKRLLKKHDGKEPLDALRNAGGFGVSESDPGNIQGPLKQEPGNNPRLLLFVRPSGILNSPKRFRTALLGDAAHVGTDIADSGGLSSRRRFRPYRHQRRQLHLLAGLLGAPAEGTEVLGSV